MTYKLKVQIGDINSLFYGKEFKANIKAKSEIQARNIAIENYACELGLSTDNIEAIIIK